MKNSNLFINPSCILPALLLLCTVNLNAQNELNGYTYLGEIWDAYDESMHYYYLSNCETTWDEANVAANEMGGYLAIMSGSYCCSYENPTVGEWAFNYVNNDEAFGGAWVGLRGENGVYLWSNGDGDEGPWWGPIYPDGAALIGDRWHDSDFQFPYTSSPVTGEAEYIVEFPFQPNCNNNPNKAFVCHNGNTICINVTALQSHLDHGDLEGPCGPCNIPAMQALPDETLATQGHSLKTADVVLSDLRDEVDITKKILPSNQIDIFPNPVSEELQVKFSDAHYESTIKILTLTGIEIQKIILQEQQSITIDLSDYNPGIYLIHVRSASGEYQKKIVKL